MTFQFLNNASFVILTKYRCREFLLEAYVILGARFCVDLHEELVANQMR